MLTDQRHLFDLDPEITYLNGAYMSPQLKSVEQAGIQGLLRKNNPQRIPPSEFIDIRQPLKQCFADLIMAESSASIAIIPSVSYGIANAAANLQLVEGDELIVAEEQFPSNIYSWKSAAEKSGARIITIAAPLDFENRAQHWNETILETINERTALVALPHTHWADGTRFDLKAIAEKVHSFGGKLVVDGTQSVGAMPFSVAEIKPDALICGGYKWLMGPYSLGVAYYAESFSGGEPIESNWMNRSQSGDFAQLTDYKNTFQPGAERFSVGESSNFILTPMLTRAIEQILEWQPRRIQEYCKTISEEAISELREMGCYIENDNWRGQHLFGIYLPKDIGMERLKNELTKASVSVTFRGKAVRVSPHVYNTKADFGKLLEAFRAAKK